MKSLSIRSPNNYCMLDVAIQSGEVVGDMVRGILGGRRVATPETKGGRITIGCLEMQTLIVGIFTRFTLTLLKR